MNNEDLTLEYKREYVEDIKKTVIAFANTSGGRIYIGIDDDGKVIGVPDPDLILLKTTNAIRDSIKPDVTLFTTCKKEMLEGKPIIAVTVQKGSACPYYLAGKGIRPEGVYIRQGASSVPATEASILKMIKETSGDNYEEIRSLNQELTFEFLKKEFVEAGIKAGKAQFKSLRLVGEDDLYNNLGMLLSDQCIHTIKLAVFEGTTKEIFKDRYEFEGSLFKQLRECYSFIDRYNRIRAEFSGLTRIDMRDYPSAAIRETLLNSIVHKDYSFSGSTLVSLFDDRMEFVTLGGLVKGISKEDMLLGVSMLRNKNLANIFYRLKLIEAFGTGIPKIMESYTVYPVHPKIETTDNVFKITLYNTNYSTSYIPRNVTPDIAKENTSPYSISGRKIFFTEGEQKVLEMFQIKDIIKRSDVEKALSISQPMAVKHLKSLLEKDAIIKIGNGKNSRYVLK